MPTRQTKSKAVIDLLNLTETGFRLLGLCNRFVESETGFTKPAKPSREMVSFAKPSRDCVLFAVDANFCSSFTVNMRVIQSKSLLL